MGKIRGICDLYKNPFKHLGEKNGFLKPKIILASIAKHIYTYFPHQYYCQYPFFSPPLFLKIKKTFNSTMKD
ncbi:hypothetical protein [Thermoanaerobacterium xylanolyticum]|uniref:hypothetical protein n=1 Tax=Thermoanaerobacterium xylanolyticum TaxID=29329 RepID=UPI0012B59BBF|nr:hypothetical protein [Thermoanaerobacterium xylanolyticum]